jgi:predicted TIM-barrel fold metal-dependent hydrolase
MRPISPSIDPIAQRSAIDALEAQRAAYRRFALQAEAQQTPLSAGDIDQVTAFTDAAAGTVGTLHDGAQRARALVGTASEQASAEQMRELERRMTDMTREARNAEVAIRNLTSQLEAWRDAYGRQLADLGVAPGTSTSGGDAPADPAARAYGQRDVVRAPRILDRKG